MTNDEDDSTNRENRSKIVKSEKILQHNIGRRCFSGDNGGGNWLGNLINANKELAAIFSIGGVVLIISQYEVNKLRVDLAASNSNLKGDINTLKSDLKGDINTLKSDLKADINTSKMRVKGDINTLKSDLKGDINASETRVKSDLQAAELRITQKIQEGFAQLKP